MEGLVFEEEEQAKDIVWTQVAFENHPEFSAGEIISQLLDRPPEERGRTKTTARTELR